MQKDTYNTSYGKKLHLVIESIFGRYHSEFEIEKKVVYNCSNFYPDTNVNSAVFVVGKIDLCYTKSNLPLEIKFPTTKEKIIKPRSYHLQQLKYYMTMENSNEGGLFYMSETAETQGSFRITMIDDVLYMEHKKLISEALALHEAVILHDPERASHIAYDRLLSWLCGTCPYAQRCLSMRIKSNGFTNVKNTNPQNNTIILK